MKLIIEDAERNQIAGIPCFINDDGFWQDSGIRSDTLYSDIEIALYCLSEGDMFEGFYSESGDEDSTVYGFWRFTK